MIEQFESRPVVIQVLPNDYFLLCLSANGYVARPIKADSVKGWILSQLPQQQEHLVVRSTDPPPTSYRGIWAEPNGNFPDFYWTRQPGTNNWVSLHLTSYNVNQYNVSGTSNLYFSSNLPGNNVYIQDFWISGQAIQRDFSQSQYYTFILSAKAGDTITDVVTIVLDEGFEDEVFRVEGGVETIIPKSQLQIFRLRAERLGNAPRLRNLSAGLRLREVRA